MNRRLLTILGILSSFITYLSINSYSTGIPGNASAGCSCHGASTIATGITISGLPANYVNGQSYAVTLNITNTSQLSAGFTLSTSLGTVSNPPVNTSLSGTTVLHHNTPTEIIAGVASFPFTWTAPAVGTTATNVFNVSANAVNDDGGTSGDSWRSVVINVAGPATPLAVSATNTTILCNAGMANITATGSGGTSPYQYQLNTGTFQSSGSFLNNVAGSYTITVKDNTNATASVVKVITQPSAITNTSSFTTVSCNGGSNGNASVGAFGGTTPYTYTWSPSGGTSATATGLVANTYTCTIKDFNNCTKLQTFVITQPTAITNTTSQTNVSCNGGTNGVASVVASGGVPSYTCIVLK